MITKQVLMSVTVTMHVRDTKESTQINRNQIENKRSLAVLLSVVLWLDKGDFPENLHTVCPCQNKTKTSVRLNPLVFGSIVLASSHSGSGFI